MRRERPDTPGFRRVVAVVGLAVVALGAASLLIHVLVADDIAPLVKENFVVIGSIVAVVASAVASRGVLRASRDAVRWGATMQALGLGLIGAGYIGAVWPGPGEAKSALYVALVIAIGFDLFVAKAAVLLSLTEPSDDSEDGPPSD